MELKLNDNVAIVKRDGKGETGVITKISDQDPIFKYEVTTSEGKVYWKSVNGIVPVKQSIPESTPKKRGRKPGSLNQSKLSHEARTVKSNDDPFTEKYRKLIETLTFEDFLKLHARVNEDYHEIGSMIHNAFGFSPKLQNDE